MKEKENESIAIIHSDPMLVAAVNTTNARIDRVEKKVDEGFKEQKKDGEKKHKLAITLAVIGIIAAVVIPLLLLNGDVSDEDLPPEEDEAIDEPEEDEAIDEPEEDEAIDEPEEDEAIDEPEEDEAIDEPEEDEAIDEPEEFLVESLTLTDLYIIYKYIVGNVILNEKQSELYDLNNDGVVDIRDASILHQFLHDSLENEVNN